MFFGVIIASVAVQCIVMLVPGIKDVFSVYSCGKHAMIPCKNEAEEEIPLGLIDANMTWKSWVASIGYALGVVIIHFIGRAFIHLKPEFKVSDKQIAKDEAIMKEREEAKEKREAEAAEKRKAAIKGI